MHELSSRNRAMIYAHETGCVVNGDGDVIGALGGKRSLYENSAGYLTFNVKSPWTSNGMNISVHRLCAYQRFGDEIFRSGIQVRHLNGDRYDNRPENIAIGTQSDNQMDRPECERKALALNAGRSNSPLNEDDVITIRNRLDGGASYSEIIRDYGIARSTVSYIKNRVTWKDI